MPGGSQASSTAPNAVRDVFHNDCPGRLVVEHITGRWATLIVAALHEEPLRFYELRDTLSGISEKVLSQKLRVLVRDGLIERTVEPSTPPRVSYALTDLGRGLSAPLEQLVRWVVDNGHAILAAQQHHDQQAI